MNTFISKVVNVVILENNQSYTCENYLTSTREEFIIIKKYFMVLCMYLRDTVETWADFALGILGWLTGPFGKAVPTMIRNL